MKRLAILMVLSVAARCLAGYPVFYNGTNLYTSPSGSTNSITLGTQSLSSAGSTWGGWITGDASTNIATYPDTSLYGTVPVISLVSNSDDIAKTVRAYVYGSTNWAYSVDYVGLSQQSTNYDVCEYVFGNRWLNQTLSAYVAPDTNYWTDPNTYRLRVRMSTNATGNVVDDSGNALACSNMITPATGPTVSYPYTNFAGVPNPLILTAASKWIRVTDNDLLSFTNREPFTLWGWVKATQAWTSYACLFEKGNFNSEMEYLLQPIEYYQNRPCITLVSQQNAANEIYAYQSAPWPTGVWVFVCCVYTGGTDSSSVFLYSSTNGTFLNTNCIQGSRGTYVNMTDGGAPLHIGSFAGRSQYAIDGYIDTCGLIPTNLSVSAISNLMVYWNPTNVQVSAGQ